MKSFSEGARARFTHTMRVLTGQVQTASSTDLMNGDAIVAFVKKNGCVYVPGQWIIRDYPDIGDISCKIDPDGDVHLRVNWELILTTQVEWVRLPTGQLEGQRQFRWVAMYARDKDLERGLVEDLLKKPEYVNAFGALWNVLAMLFMRSSVAP